jgi:cytochrome P450
MLPPGPRTPAFWQTFRFVTDPRGYSRRVLASHGGVTRFRALNTKGVSIQDPQVARQVFAMSPDVFVTPPVLGDVFGALSVLATSGDTHKRQRKLLNPHSTGRR